MDAAAQHIHDVRHDWRRLAACRDQDTSLFFPGGATGVHAEQAARAKTVCAGCQVVDQCLHFALETNQWHGIWGGCTQDERVPLRRAWRLRKLG